MQNLIYDYKGMTNNINTMGSIQCLHSLNLIPSLYFKNINKNVPKHAIGIPLNWSLDCQHPMIWEGMLGHSGS